MNTARMMEALRSSGVGHSAAGAAAQREYEERVRRAKELRPKRPLTTAQLASEAACNAVIAEQRSIVFAKPPDLTEAAAGGSAGRGRPGGAGSHEAILSLMFDTLTIGDFVVGSNGGRQRAGAWAPPQHGSSAPPEAEPISYSSTAEGLWCSTAIERTAVLREQRSHCSGLSIQKDWSQQKSSRVAAAEATCLCPHCSSKVGKQVGYVPSQESLEAMAKAGTLAKPPPNYRPGARTEKEKAPQLPRVYLAQAVRLPCLAQAGAIVRGPSGAGRRRIARHSLCTSMDSCRLTASTICLCALFAPFARQVIDVKPDGPGATKRLLGGGGAIFLMKTYIICQDTLGTSRRETQPKNGGLSQRT